MIITKDNYKNFGFNSKPRLWWNRCYGNGSNAVQWFLSYDCQLEFKRIASRYFGLKADYYFDGLNCVDGRTQKNIPGVKCNGELQWGEAIDKLKKHFKIAC